MTCPDSWRVCPRRLWLDRAVVLLLFCHQELDDNGHFGIRSSALMVIFMCGHVAVREVWGGC